MRTKHTELQHMDMIGSKFGKLTVVERDGTKKTKTSSANRPTYRAVWRCVCECGNEVHKTTQELHKGRYTKCKECAYADRPQSAKRHTAVERLFHLKVVNGLDRRDIALKMTADEYYNIAKHNCFYCQEEPKEFHLYKGKFSKKESLFVNGVDRVDSSGPYSVDNCVPCCFDCNAAKRIQTQEQFFNKIEKIYNIHIKEKK